MNVLFLLYPYLLTVCILLLKESKMEILKASVDLLQSGYTKAQSTNQPNSFFTHGFLFVTLNIDLNQECLFAKYRLLFASFNI